MKGIFLTILLLFTFVAVVEVEAQSRPGDFEVGFMVGEPTGISMKYWQSDLTAYDVVMAWSFGRHESLHLHASYLKHSPLEVEDELFSLYYGIGGRAIFADSAVFGARIPVGLQYIIPSARLSVFFEVAPTFDLVPATEFGVDGGVGVRFFF